MEIADLSFSYTFDAPAACKILRTIESWTSMASALTLVIISIDRHKRICKFGDNFSNKAVKRLCLLALLVGALLAWPALIIVGKKTIDLEIPGVKGADCSTSDEMKKTVYPLIKHCLQIDLSVLLYLDKNMNSTGTTDNTSSLSDLDLAILLQELNDKTALRFLPVIIYMALLMLVGTFGNIMVCIVYLRKRMKNSSDYFILNLAFLELLTCVIRIPVEIADLRHPYMFYAPAACKLLRTIESFSNLASTSTLTVIALDRYKRICKLGKRFSKQEAKCLCIAAVVIGAMTGWPAAVVFGRKSVDAGIPGAIGVRCSTADIMKNTTYPLLFFGFIALYFIVCVIFIMFIYVRISIFIRMRKSTLKKETSPPSSPLPSSNLQPISKGQSKESYHQREIKTISRVNTKNFTKTTTIFVVISIVFVVSYLPFFVVMVTRSIKTNFESILSPGVEVLYKFCLKSYFINNAINPIIYGFLNRNFRAEVIKIIMKCN
ncbi:orexin receptor type 2-like [Saccostrea cucullata]|uniref:orexin receptor type 2-like n=1 Tax=Saccostrea cuccullata TaxID=36930 RepID=UPI002ED06482